MVSFVKMHGLGNDFVVIDGRAAPFAPDEGQIRTIADRRRGVGCDQLVLIEPAQNGAAARLRFFNADGGEAGACGNGTRCAAAHLMAENGTSVIELETSGGALSAKKADDDLFTVDMGPARLDWADIPVGEAMDTLHLPVSNGPLSDPVGVGMGNPHCVFFVEDAEAIDLAELGPNIEHHALFPERTNVEIASPKGEDRFRLRVWERGVGITEACGTGACATAVAAHRRELAGRKVVLDLDGGQLDIEWREADSHVLMTGPVATSFTGEIAT
ncbi:MAG: diaminopimelate epimerase [Rhodospirillaceae bacterium]|nr:diaminopimelate epimerase [Rhodospirillaceae bacterium]